MSHLFNDFTYSGSKHFEQRFTLTNTNTKSTCQLYIVYIHDANSYIHVGGWLGGMQIRSEDVTLLNLTTIHHTGRAWATSCASHHLQRQQHCMAKSSLSESVYRIEILILYLNLEGYWREWYIVPRENSVPFAGISGIAETITMGLWRP